MERDLDLEYKSSGLILDSVISKIKLNMEVHKNTSDIVELVRYSKEFDQLMADLHIARNNFDRISHLVWIREHGDEL